MSLLNLAELFSDSDVYYDPIPKPMIKHANNYLEKGELEERTTLFTVVNFLEFGGEITSGAVVDWFMSLRFAESVKHNGYTARSYLQLLYKCKWILREVEKVIGYGRKSGDPFTSIKDTEIEIKRRCEMYEAEQKISKSCCIVIIPLAIHEAQLKKRSLDTTNHQPKEVDKDNINHYLKLAATFNIDVFESFDDAIVKSNFSYKYVFSPSGSGKSHFCEIYHKCTYDGDHMVNWPKKAFFWKSWPMDKQIALGLEHIEKILANYDHKPIVLFNPNLYAFEQALLAGKFDRVNEARKSVIIYKYNPIPSILLKLKYHREWSALRYSHSGVYDSDSNVV